MSATKQKANLNYTPPPPPTKEIRKGGGGGGRGRDFYKHTLCVANCKLSYFGFDQHLPFGSTTYSRRGGHAGRF